MLLHLTLHGIQGMSGQQAEIENNVWNGQKTFGKNLIQVENVWNGVKTFGNIRYKLNNHDQLIANAKTWHSP